VVAARATNGREGWVGDARNKLGWERQSAGAKFVVGEVYCD